MKYGRHTHLVEEVINFAKTGPMLTPAGPPPLDVELIHDFAAAKRKAWEESSSGDEGLLWKDIRDAEMAKVFEHRYALQGFESPDERLGRLVEVLPSYIRRHLPQQYVRLLGTISDDLFNVAYARAVYGDERSFFEPLYRIYRSGCWPCGWSGAYPEGHLIAFVPLADVVDQPSSWEQTGEGSDEGLDPLTRVIEEMCRRIGEPYAGYHVLSGGELDGKPCVKIAFHVGVKERPTIRMYKGKVYFRKGGVFWAYVGDNRTVLMDDHGRTRAVYRDITRDNLVAAGETGAQ